MTDPRPAAPKFRIVHRPIPESRGLLLQRAANHDRATVLYHEELRRLQHERAYGEVALLRVDGEQRTMLRESLR